MEPPSALQARLSPNRFRKFRLAPYKFPAETSSPSSLELLCCLSATVWHTETWSEGVFFICSTCFSLLGTFAGSRCFLFALLGRARRIFFFFSLERAQSPYQFLFLLSKRTFSPERRKKKKPKRKDPDRDPGGVRCTDEAHGQKERESQHPRLANNGCTPAFHLAQSPSLSLLSLSAFHVLDEINLFRLSNCTLYLGEFPSGAQVLGLLHFPSSGHPFSVFFSCIVLCSRPSFC